MIMKRLIYILLIIFIFVLVVSIFSKQIILFLAKQQLKSIFRESKVSVGGLNFSPLHHLNIFDIEIKKDKIYDFKIQEAGIYYDIFSVLRGGIDKFYLRDTSVSIDLAQDNIAQFSRYLSLKPHRIFYLKNLVFLNLNVNVKSKDLNFTQNGPVLKDIKINMDKKTGYLADVEVMNFDLETFIRDFKLGEKLQLSGRLNGRITLGGEGSNIKIIKGYFLSVLPGGMLVIKDKSFLQEMARNTKQPLDILVESFKDYHYNTGALKLSLQKNNLIFNIALEGKTGKRNLNITLHNFFRDGS